MAAYRRINLPLLKNYAKIFGDLEIPARYVVPDASDTNWSPQFHEVKIGSYLAVVKSLIKKGCVFVEEDVKAALNLGLNLDSKRSKSELYLSAFKLYREKHPGHKFIATNFTIDSDDILWPKEMRGLKLGTIFNGIKHKKLHQIIHEYLLALQFDLTAEKVTKPIDLSLFEQYLKVEGDLLIPLDFVVPSDDKKWPKKYHDVKLGKLVNKIRVDVTRKIDRFDKDDIQKLVDLGFPLSHHEAKRKGVLLAFKSFKEKFGHLNVITNGVNIFKIDKDDLSWPQETRGMSLGETLVNIRHLNHHKAIHKDLIELGVDLGPQKTSHDFERVFKALSDYKAVHGNVIVPQNFVVPRGDAAYSENAWGLKLGINLLHIRVDGCYFDHRDRLEALGVSFEVNRYDVRGFDVVYSALEAYKSVHGDLLVPQKFVVPHGDVNYPPDTWGMKLGTTVQSIRSGVAHKQHRVKLEELGFVFKNNKRVVELD
jgi:hypothetical protein